MRVFGFDGARNPDYDLEIDLTDCGCREDRECPAGQACVDRRCTPIALCVDDRLEENDGPADAAPLPAGEADGLRVCGGDDDWYAVEICAGGTLTIDARFAHAAGDLDLSLHTRAGLLLAESTSAD